MAELSNLQIRWLDRGREPKCPPNPLYPNGKPIDCTGGATRFCETALPCPARRFLNWHYKHYPRTAEAA
jgi:hypothetical protein